MDRNRIKKRFDGFQGVALRKESVDRNGPQRPSRALARVALRKESVDRNAGIITSTGLFRVALRKESVDRNLPLTRNTTPNCESLSARRAWIEIPVYNDLQCIEYRRSPQGERG